MRTTAALELYGIEFMPAIDLGPGDCGVIVEVLVGFNTNRFEHRNY